MNEYAFEVGATDIAVAFDCEADRAEREGFPSVANRQRDNALHVRNADHHLQKFCPEGYRVRTRVVVDYVPAVNACVKDEYRK